MNAVIRYFKSLLLIELLKGMALTGKVAPYKAGFGPFPAARSPRRWFRAVARIEVAPTR